MHKQAFTQATAKFIAAIMMVMLALAVLPVAPASAAGPVTVLQNWPANPQLTATTANLSGTFTISAGSERLLVVAVDVANNNVAITFTATYGGKPLTQAATNTSLGNFPSTWIGYLKEADIASRTSDALVVTFSGAQKGAAMYIASYSGVNQTTPISAGAGYYDSNQSTIAIGPLAANTGGYGIYTWGGIDSRTRSSDTEGYAEHSDLMTAIGGLKSYGMASKAINASTTPTITWSGNSRVSLSFITLNPAPTPTKVLVETAADGSGTVVPAQSITSGSSLTVYAITRNASNNFVANVAADVWSLPTKTGGVVDGDLVAAGDSKSATFTGHVAGTATIRATSGALATTDSGTITVPAGTATKVLVETAANGSGTVVAAQSITSGSSLTVYAITHDASDNFVANVAATAWSLPTKTGGVVDGDLVAAGDSKSATFTGHVAGTATIRATSGALATTDSGTITVTAGTAAKLAYTTVPSTGTAGTAFSVTVQSQDASGNPASPTSDTTITLSKATGGGTLTGTLTGIISTSSNSVTISTPVYSKSDTMTLTATATAGMTGLTAVTSGDIVFSAGTATKLVVTLPGQTFTSGSGNSGTVTAQTAGTAFNITSITATDANFNTVTSYSGPKTLSYSGPGGTPSYTTAVSFTSGVSTTTLATTLTRAETTTITASDTITTGPASSSLTVYATGTWLGTTGPDWNTASNWWGGVPISSTDVVIPSTAPNQPVIGASGGVCRNITIDAGASLTISDSYNLSVSGNWTNNGSLTANSSAVNFNGTSAQTISGSTTFNKLTINNTNGITASSDMTVNGVLNLQSANPSATKGSLDMWDGSAMKTLTMGADATTIGAGDVTGIVKRTTLVAATSYTFGNQYTTIDFRNVGTLPTDVSVKINIGSAPAWKTGAVQRTYDIIRTGGSGSFATISLHYLDAELNGNTENTLVIWDGQLPSPPGIVEEHGRSNYDTTNKWVGMSNIDISHFATAFDSDVWTLGDTTLSSATWNGSISTNWSTPANWSPGGVPSDLSDVVIPDGSTTPNDPISNLVLAVGRLTINSGGILNATAGSTITISGASGAWSNNGGAFNPSTSTVIFTNAAATISGATDFYNVTIDSGAWLRMASGTTMRIGGTVTNNGTWGAAAESGTTVEYNGGSQAVLNSNGLTPGYRNLILSGSGNKTLASTTTINGTVDIKGTAKFNLTYASGSPSTVGSLTFGGVLQAAGSWGSTSSTAAHKDDTHFQGTGELNVSTGSADHITITSSTANLSSGSTRGITAELRDANENVVTSDNSTVVSFTQTSGSGSVSGTGDATASSGVATKTVTGGTAGSVTLTASATGPTSGTTTFTVTSGTADATTSTLTPASASITADGTSTQVLTVTAKDAHGNNVGVGGATVTITKSSGTGSVGAVTDHSDGTYTATVTAPSLAGSGVFVATLGGSPVKGGTGSQTQATVTYVAVVVVANAAHSTIGASPTSIAADGSSTSTITVQARDVNNTNLTTGGATVVISKSSGTGTLGSTADNGNGMYTATLTAPTAAGSATLAATLDGTAVGTAVGASSATVTYVTGPGPEPVSKLVVTLPGQTFTSGSGNSGTVTAQTAGTAFNLTLTAVDASNNTNGSYSGTKTISYSGPGGTPTYTTSVTFTNGQATSVSTTLTKAEVTTITASDGTMAGLASSSLTVNAAGQPQQAVPIPTLTEWGMLIMALLLAGVAGVELSRSVLKEG